MVIMIMMVMTVVGDHDHDIPRAERVALETCLPFSNYAATFAYSPLLPLSSYIPCSLLVFAMLTTLTWSHSFKCPCFTQFLENIKGELTRTTGDVGRLGALQHVQINVEIASNYVSHSVSVSPCSAFPLGLLFSLDLPILLGSLFSQNSLFLLNSKNLIGSVRSLVSLIFERTHISRCPRLQIFLT